MDASANASVIVLDGMALLRKMYPADLEWIVGGQFQEVWLNVSAFVSAFAAQGLHLVVFMDGGHVIKAGDPRQTFDQPQQAHTREFVEKILRH